MPQEAPHSLSTEGSGEVPSGFSHSAEPQSVLWTVEAERRGQTECCTALAYIRVLKLPAQRLLDRRLRKQSNSFAVPKAGSLSTTVWPSEFLLGTLFLSVVFMTAFSLFLPEVNLHLLLSFS